MKRFFASDNCSGVHPEFIKAISEVNEGHVIGYGGDLYTEAAIKEFKNNFDSIFFA